MEKYILEFLIVQTQSQLDFDFINFIFSFVEPSKLMKTEFNA
jgi:hypothetical protein